MGNLSSAEQATVSSLQLMSELIQILGHSCRKVFKLTYFQILQLFSCRILVVTEVACNKIAACKSVSRSFWLMTHVLHPLSKTERPVCILTVYVSPIPIRCILFNYRWTQEGGTRESAARGNWPTVQTNGFAFSNEMFMFIRMVVITKLDKTKYHITEKNRRKPVMQMCTILTLIDQ